MSISAMPFVRHAERDEIPEIAALISAAIEPFRDAIPDKLLETYLSRSRDIAGRWESCDIFVAETYDGKIAGTLSYALPSRIDDHGMPAGGATLRSLMVHPRMQGQGYGRRLVEHSIAAARRDGALAISLHTAGFMTSAQCLYRAVGFARNPAKDVLASGFTGFDPANGDVQLLAYWLEL